MTKHAPTDEQAAAIDAFRTGSDMTLEAFAGTGKTTTLKLLAAATDAKGVYVAFNKATADDAKGSFPRNTEPRTMHSFAYAWMCKDWGRDALQYRLSSSRLPQYMVAKMLGLRGPNAVGDKFLGPHQIARIAMDTVRIFCQSADPEPNKWHVPRQPGVDDDDAHDQLRALVLPYARKAWDDLSTKNGQLRYTHDTYLKMFALSEPTLPGDFLFLDEAQDTNGVVLGIVRNNQDNMQVVAVGDPFQAIYGWRGASDALAKMDTPHRMVLTKSWRFGPAVAEEANKWLRMLGSSNEVVGSPHILSDIAALPSPDAILCRTNAEAVAALMEYQAERIPTCVVGGGGDFKRLAEAAEELAHKGSTNHPELAAFESWGQVQDYVEHSSDGGDLKVAVDLIDEWGADTIIRAIDSQVPEHAAKVLVSTAHKAKGREWSRVRIAEDFREPMPDKLGRPVMPNRAEMMLAYVSVTRAMHTLDPRGLAWVNHYPAAAPRVPEPALAGAPA